jgi:starch-binding outer membrane protein, SusD/RagB family
MTMTNANRRGRPGSARRQLRLLVLAAVPLVGACDLDTILEARDPFTVTPGTARDTANLNTLYAGARSQFALAYAGQQNREGGIVMMSGLMSDELYSSDNFGTRQAVDRRDINYEISNSASDHSFIYLQRARAEALNAIELYEGSPRAGNARHSELYSIAGYAVVLLAENFCAGIPLSRITETGVEFGEPRSAVELYELAVTYFDAALALPASDPQVVHLARVGKARALLDLGRFVEAAELAAQVPSGYLFEIQYSAGSFFTPNAIFNMNNEERRFSVSLQEGTVNRGLPFGAVAAEDPRISIAPLPAPSNSGAVDTWLQLRYPSQGADVPLASGTEARLIQAEAQLDRGNSAAYLTTLNQLRASIGLSALTDPGTPAGRVDQFFAERAYFLWLTGHRLSDMRRLVRQYGRDQASVFPTGLTAYGQAYGTDVTLPIPFEEVNNPNYGPCTDRGA